MSDFLPGMTQRVVCVGVHWVCGHHTTHDSPAEIPPACPECAAYGAGRYRARKVMPDLSGYAVHHSNGDATDNRPENLRLVPISENRRRK